MAKIRDDPYQEVYNHFLAIYPKLKNEVIGYRPYGFMTILLYFPDGGRMLFSDSDRRAKFVSIN